MTHRLRGALVLAAVAAWVPAWAGAPRPQGQPHDHNTGQQETRQAPDGSGRDAAGGGHHAGGMAQMAAIHELFVNHDRITRTVTSRPDGIRTVTESADPRVAELVRTHVADSIRQIESGVDPGLPIESEALRALYANHDRIRTTVEPTATGVIVTQTSSDPKVVAALQQHAAEVSEFVKDGMAAMHRAMMKNGGGMRKMHDGMKERRPDETVTPAPR